MGALGMGAMFLIPALIVIIPSIYMLWEWNDKRKTRKSIQVMAKTQAESLQMQQAQNGFGAPPPTNGTAAKWGR